MISNKSTARGAGTAILVCIVLVLSVVALSISGAGAQSPTADTYDDGPTFAGESFSEVWIGQELTLVDDGTFDGDYISIATGPEPSDSTDAVVTERYNKTDNTVTFETDALEADEIYHIYAYGDSDKFDFHGEGFRATTENLEAEFGSSTVNEDDSVSLSFESERDEQHLNVTADDFEADELESIFGSEHAHPAGYDDGILLENVSGGDSFEADFTDIDIGEYEFTFDVADSNATTTATIDVTDSADYAFGDITHPEQGEIATIDLEVTDADTAAVVLGDPADRFESSVALEEIDDETITLEYNTHAAATEGAWSVHEDSNATIVDEAVTPTLDADEPLPAHNWALSVGNEFEATHDLETEFDRDVLVVGERTAIGESALATAPADTTITDADSLNRTTVTPTETVAEGDALLVTIDEFGADGLVRTLEDDSSLAELGLELEIEEGDAGPVAAPHVWNTSATAENGADALAVDVLEAGDADAYDGTLSMLVTTDSHARALEPGAEYTVRVRTTDENAYIDDDEAIEQERGLSLVEREFEWEPLETMPIAQNATATGTTTVAPGTELRATADSPLEEGGFIQMTDAVVEEAGAGEHSFAAAFDFSAMDPGVGFDLLVEDPAGDSESAAVREDVELTEVGEPAFEVAAEAPTSVAVDEHALLEVTVTNNGTNGGESNYSVTVDGETVANETLALEADESVVKTYEFETGTEGTLEWEAVTDDGTERGTVSVEREATDDEASDASPRSDADNGTETPASDDGTPGFGVAVALGALLVAVALAARSRPY